MLKVFISQPMKDRTPEEIKNERAQLEKIAKNKCGNDCVIIDSYFPNFDGNGLQFLGKSLMRLGEADAAIFGSGWENYRGCKIEHLCCEEYGVRIIE
jgi:hypothetical protein